MTAPLTCWVISDGRRGIENQALGLAEAMAEDQSLNIEPRHISRTGFLAKFPPGLQKFFGRKSSLDGDIPNIAIGCGRQAIVPLMELKAKGVFTVYVQDPRIGPGNFDVVIAPEHDRISGDNVMRVIGSPNRITEERLIADKALAKPLTDKVATFLIGGKSKTHDYAKTDIEAHAELILDLLDKGWQVFMTVSRRTPIRALEYFSHFYRDFETFELYSGQGPNPYFAYLYHADLIFVTEDSTNMLTEACTTGKPVFRLGMSGNPGKFQRLYDRLEKRCHVKRAVSTDLTPQNYAPLTESRRAAAYVWDKFHKNV